MNTPENNQSPQDPGAAETGPPSGGTSQRARLPYQKPVFRHEKVFETQALTCGKANSTQGACNLNRKTS